MWAKWRYSRHFSLLSKRAQQTKRLEHMLSQSQHQRPLQRGVAVASLARYQSPPAARFLTRCFSSDFKFGEHIGADDNQTSATPSMDSPDAAPPVQIHQDRPDLDDTIGALNEEQQASAPGSLELDQVDDKLTVEPTADGDANGEPLVAPTDTGDMDPSPREGSHPSGNTDLSDPAVLEQRILHLERKRRSEMTLVMTFKRAMSNYPDLVPTRATFDAVLNACGHRGTGWIAAKIVDIAHRLDVMLASRSYNAALKAIMREGRPEEAMRIFKSMRRKPTVESYNYTLASFSSQGRMDDALEIIDMMSAEGVNPNQFTCSRIVEGFLRAREPLTALSWLNRMGQEDFTVEPKLYSNVMVHCGYCGEVDMVPDLLPRYDESAARHAVLNELEKPPQLSIGAMTSILFSASAVGGVAMVDQMWNRLRESYPDYKVPLSTYYLLLDARASDGKINGALEVIQQATEAGYETTLPNLKLVKRAICRNPEKLDEIRASLSQDAKAGKKADGGLLNCVIEAYGTIDEPENAMELARGMAAEFGVSPSTDTYNALLSGVLSSNRILDESEVIEMMEEAQVARDWDTIRLLCLIYVRRGETALAVEVLEDAVQAGQEPSVDAIRCVVRRAAMDGSEELIGRAIEIGKMSKGSQYSYATLRRLGHGKSWEK